MTILPIMASVESSKPEYIGIPLQYFSLSKSAYTENDPVVMVLIRAQCGHMRLQIPVKPFRNSDSNSSARFGSGFNICEIHNLHYFEGEGINFSTTFKPMW